MNLTVKLPDEFIDEFNELKKKVAFLEDLLVDKDLNELMNELTHVEPMSVAQIVTEFEISRPTLKKYEKKGIIKSIYQSPMLFDRKDVLVLLKAIKPRLYA